MIGKFKIKNPNGFIERGVPPRSISQLQSIEDWLETVIVKDYSGSIISKITPIKQIRVFSQELKNPDVTPLVFGFSGTPDSTKSSIACLHLFNSYYDSGNGQPLWHLVNGSSYDFLRDNQDYRSSKGYINFLVIDGLADHATSKKVEKAFDLLMMYRHIPRAFIVSGVDAAEFADKILRTKIDRIIHTTNVKIIEV